MGFMNSAIECIAELRLNFAVGTASMCFPLPNDLHAPGDGAICAKGRHSREMALVVNAGDVDLFVSCSGPCAVGDRKEANAGLVHVENQRGS